MLMMLPFEAPTIFEGIHKSYFRMPRIVKDQRSKFENDDLFRQLSHESAVKYTGFKDRPLEERQMKFIANCQEGHTEVSVVQSGNQFTLMFNPTLNPACNTEGCDFDKEHGKVHIKSGFILNGVCVLWRGWIDLNRLEGFGCLEFDEYRAYLEDAMLKQQIDKQQTCNTANHQPSPLGRLNQHQLGVGGPHQFGPGGAAAAAAVAAAAANQLGPLGLGPQCLGPPPPHPGLQQQQAQQQPPPPVSLADSAAHYGNAAIAAAAAAAFHQALGVGGPPTSQSLHGLGPPQSTAAAVAAAAAAASGPPPPATLPLVPVSQPHQLPHQHPHLGYSSPNGPPMQTNGPLIPPVSAAAAAAALAAATGNHHHHHHHHHLNNQHQHHQTGISPPAAQSNHHTNSHTNGTSNNTNTRTPERDSTNHQRLSRKRSLEPDQTQLDDVDVVSDIHAHDLDFPPRRMFKSSPITTGQHHRQARRA